ncbi:hypothetical protein [Psychroserpens sp. MEBiC05023]
MKKVAIGITLVFVFFGLLYGGIHLFGWHIFNSQSCSSFNIDNIELRTGVDIPKVISTDCECKNNTKISKFIVDIATIDLERYVTRNNFSLIDNLYIKENDNKHSTYKVIFNQKTGELTVNLTYKNN